MFSNRKTIYTTFIILIICFFMICGLSSYREEQLAVKMAAQQVNNTLDKVTAMIEPSELKGLISSREENDPYYSLLRQQLIQSAADHGLADIYIVAKTTDKKWCYIADSREVSDPLFNPLGQEEFIIPTIWEKAIRGTRIEPELTRGDRGTVISAYRPVKDEQGQIYAFIAGDYNAAQISDYIYVTLYVQIGMILFAAAIICWIWRKTLWK